MTWAIVTDTGNTWNNQLFIIDKEGIVRTPVGNKSSMTCRKGEGQVFDLTINGVEHTKVRYPDMVPNPQVYPEIRAGSPIAPDDKKIMGSYPDIGKVMCDISGPSLGDSKFPIWQVVDIDAFNRDCYFLRIATDHGYKEYKNVWNGKKWIMTGEWNEIRYWEACPNMNVKSPTHGDYCYQRTFIYRYQGSTLKQVDYTFNNVYMVDIDLQPNSLVQPIVDMAYGIVRNGSISSDTNSIVNLQNLNFEKLVKYLDENKSNNLESLGDLVSLVGAIRHPSSIGREAKKLSSAFKDVFTKSDESFLRKASRLYSKAKMTYDWSLAPVPEDISNTVKGIGKYLKDTGWDNEYEKHSFTSTGSFSTIFKDVDVLYKNAATSTIYMWPQKKRLLNCLGLDITCAQIWETLPLSFLVDMFYDVKDIFEQAHYESFIADLNDYVYGVCQSYKTEAVATTTQGTLYITHYSRSFKDKIDFSHIERESYSNIGRAVETIFKLVTAGKKK